METTHSLDHLFYPKNIAVIGASPKRKWGWSSGNSWIAGSFRLAFQGPIYPVHPKAKTVLGLNVYPSILDIPVEIDLAIFTVPFTNVIEVMEQCVKKGVKFVHLLTAGFSETGREDYADLENQIAQIARKGGIRLVGPNCMGIYCPEGGLSWADEFPVESGSTGFFSQSGQIAYQVIRKGDPRKIRFSKVVSYGNASDLQAHDFLNYLADDEKTTIIGAYVEGIKNGRAFFEAAKKATKKKPLVIWKGGQTEGGSRATLSHTSAIAGSQKIWQAVCAQSGIIQVHSLEEMVHTLQAFQMMSIPKGTRVAILGGAGGGSVTMTDFAEKENLTVPRLSEKTIQKLEEFVPLQGSSVKNPLDMMPALTVEGNLIRVMKLLRDDPNIDALIFNMSPNWIYKDYGRTALNSYLQLSLEAKQILEKPFFISLGKEDNIQTDILHKEVEEWLHEAGVATFPDFRLTARVLNNMKKYGDYLDTR